MGKGKKKEIEKKQEEENALVEAKKNEEKGIKKDTLVKIMIGLVVLIVILGVMIVSKKYVNHSSDDDYDPEVTVSTNQDNQIEEEKETKEEDKEEKEPEVKEEDDLVHRLFNIFRLDKHVWAWNEYNYEDNRSKLRLAYENISKNDRTTIECSKVGGIMKKTFEGKEYTSYCGEYYYRENLKTEEEINNFIESNLSTMAVDSKLMKEKIQELFGSDFNYQAEDFGLLSSYIPTNVLMHYDSNYDIYVNYFVITGLTYVGFSEEITNSYEKDDKLYIESRVQESEGAEAMGITGKTFTYEFKKDVNTGKYVFSQIIKDM